MLDRADRPGRRRPFSSWMKKLTNFKGGSTTADVASAPTTTKRNTYQLKTSGKKGTLSKNNNPYPQSAHLNGSTSHPNDNRSFSTVPTGSMSASSLDRSRQSQRSSLDGVPQKSVAATVSTEPDRAHSDAAPSHAPSSGEATSHTVGCGVSSARGADSTFSSPAPSVRSLTTTLTTIQSVAPMAPQQSHHANNNTSIHFSHQFPTSPPQRPPCTPGPSRKWWTSCHIQHCHCKQPPYRQCLHSYACLFFEETQTPIHGY
jgi:hypothetical protein